VVNVYTAQKGVWSVTARVSAIVTSSCLFVAACLFGIYNFWALAKVQELHEKELPPIEKAVKKNKKNRESVIDKVKRKAMEPAMLPGSVV